jgi:GT2 family glycosyltransferase
MRSHLKPVLSIVVPTFNRRATLTRLLDALGQQTVAPGSVEVVVVDDGSTDGTVEMLHAYDSDRVVVRVAGQPHRGPAAARNLGVELARAELIMFLDDDVVPQPDLVERHIAEHASDRDLVVIGPMRPPLSWPRPAWIRWEEELLQVQYQELAEGKYACTPRQFYTANASLRRERFLAVGGFDSGFKRAEDVELAYRMRDTGARFVFLPHAGVTHYASRSFAAWSKTPYQYGRYDVVMHRDKGHEALWCAATEFERRHALNRAVARLCVGRKPLVKSAVLGLRGVVFVTDRLGARRSAIVALSGIFNVLYWQGAADELGGARALWRLLAEWRRIGALEAAATV